MIIYDQRKFGGMGVLFHRVGSAIFNGVTMVPASAAAIVTAVVANVPELNVWFADRILQGTVVFSAYTFIVSMLLVTRSRESLRRYDEAQRSYFLFSTKLNTISMMISSALSPGKKDETMAEKLSIKLMRWVRLSHVLAVEEFEGYQDPSKRLRCLTLMEEIILFREKRKTTRVFLWLFRSICEHRDYFAGEASMMTNLFRLLDVAHENYVNCRRIAETPYTFPLAQLATFAIWSYTLVASVCWGTFLPNSYFYAPLVAFFVTTTLFGANLAAEYLETPFDFDVNDLPMSVYSLDFFDDLNSSQFSPTPVVFPLNLHDGDVGVEEEGGGKEVHFPRDIFFPLKVRDRHQWKAEIDRSVLPREASRLRARAKVVYRLRRVKSAKHHYGGPRFEHEVENQAALRARGEFKVVR